MTDDWFTRDLRIWGPDSRSPRPTVDQARAYCRRLARRHYENFTVASWLLPAALRSHICNVYAYCRWSDNLADRVADTQQSLALLDWWEQQLNSCYQGQTHHPVFVALQETIQQFAIPPVPFQQLLVAFRQDRQQDRYQTWEELESYCRHSANPVGHLVLHLGRCCNPENQALSDSICTGLQLANFCQGVAEDWERGRFYFPEQICQVEGYSPPMYGQDSPSWRRVLRHHVQQAESLLHAGRPLVGRMPRSLRIEIDLFLRGGLAILKTIRQRKFEVWSGQPKIGRLQKMMIVAAACRGAAWGGANK